MAYFFLALFDGGASLSGGEMMSRNRLRMIWRKKESKNGGNIGQKGDSGNAQVIAQQKMKDPGEKATFSSFSSV